MTELQTAKQALLNPATLDEGYLAKLLSSIAKKGIDDADLYFQSSATELWYLEDGKVKGGSYSIDKGVGIRAVSGEKTGYAYCDEITLPQIERAAKAAQSIALQSSKTNAVAINDSFATKSYYTSLNPLSELDNSVKIALLQRVDAYARKLDSRITQVKASLSGSYEVILIAGLQTPVLADIRPLVSLNVTVMAEANGRRESGRSGSGGRVSYQWFMEENRAEKVVDSAVHEALNNLKAEDAPAGTMPVVLGSGWPGVLLHEAVGHGLEGDFNRKGQSVFSNRIGEQVAAAGITVVDNGTIPNRRGSLTIDDEGTPTQDTVLIENGRLVNYMQDRLNARLMGMKPTGNCRRESYAHRPMPRMTNTYMLSGNHHPEEIISSVKRGLYAVNFGGGQVDITSGQFVFSASEAYMIENGKITYPVRGATLIGSGPVVMQNISMVGNDLALDEGIGMCGKEGQSVPVGVGQPTLKIDALTVGGTRT